MSSAVEVTSTTSSTTQSFGKRLKNHDMSHAMAWTTLEDVVLHEGCCCCLLTESCLTLLRPQIQKQVATSCFRGLPDPGIKPMSPALAGGFFTAEQPEKPPSKMSQSQKDTSIVWFQLYEVPRVVKFIDKKIEWWFPESRGGSNGKLLLNGYRASVLQDEKVLETGCLTVWMCLLVYT